MVRHHHGRRLEDDDEGSEARRFSISVVDIPVSKREVLSTGTTWEKHMKEKTLGEWKRQGFCHRAFIGEI